MEQAVIVYQFVYLLATCGRRGGTEPSTSETNSSRENFERLIPDYERLVRAVDSLQ